VRRQGNRQFKRSEFGMKYGLPAALGDEVKLWMSFYGFRD
jgi:polyisoprenoid-binding protein YceI